ncbi:MAG: hypothetical protein RIB45_15570 [Marivibrio sp.]|uniref:hypothetical protein n=1 Tax=Marivibrio sp. TaxID=2039719 RepID=UPI0032EAEAB5
MIDGAPTTARARAVALADVTQNCVWALNPSVSGAITVAGGASVSIGCGMIANSTNASAVDQSGRSRLTAAVVKSAGGADGTCINPQPRENVAPRPDPLADLQAPSYGGCDHTGKTKITGSGAYILSPGVYCGSIVVSSDATVIFELDVYVLDGAGLNIGAQATIQGSDVSFYLSPSSGTSDNVSISAGASVDLTAPAGGPTPGVLFYHDRNAPTNVSHDLTGGVGMTLEGIVYFPNHNAKVAGGASLSLNETMIIADTVTFTGNTSVGNISGSVEQSNPDLVSVRLVE